MARPPLLCQGGEFHSDASRHFRFIVFSPTRLFCLPRSGATDYPPLVAVSSGRNRQGDLTRLAELKQVRQAKAVQKLVLTYPFRSVAPFSHPIPSIGWRWCLRTLSDPVGESLRNRIGNGPSLIRQ